MKVNLKQLKNTPPWDWPRDTDKALLAILEKREAPAVDRLRAAELAGDYNVVNDALASALLAIVRDGQEAEDLRARAAISLGPALEHCDTAGFDDPDDIVISEEKFEEIQEALRDLYRKADLPDLVRRKVLEASVRAPQSWHHKAVREAYARGEEAWKLTAVFSMCYVDGFEDEILSSLQSDIDMVHYHAVQAAGNWGVVDAWDHLVELATSDDTEKDLRIAAIEAVTNVRPDEVEDILSDLLSDDDEDIVTAAEEALAIADAIAEYDDSRDDSDPDEDDEDEEDEEEDYGDFGEYEEDEEDEENEEDEEGRDPPY